MTDQYPVSQAVFDAERPKLRVLIACEFSGIVREAFAKRGHDAWSCDLLPTEGNPAWHFQEDIFAVLKRGRFDLGIFHPPCTYLASSGLHWNKRRPERGAKTEEALEFVRALLDAPIPKIALENPIGCISTRIRKPDQIIQPWQFGEDASKATCLWLKGLPLLTPTKIIVPRHGNLTKPVFANQTASGQNKLSPSKHRQADRSRTYRGIANAFASQWG